MHVSILPQYTDERYYVLSEIEQRANFHAADEMEISNDNQEVFQVGDFTALYILLDLRGNFNQVVDTLIKKIERVVKVINLGNTELSRCFLSVEVIIKKSGATNWEECKAKDIIEQAFNAVASSFNFGFYGFGVADDVGATPALNAILQWLLQIGSGIPQVATLAKYGTLVKIGFVHTVSRDTLLGFCADRSPDAASSVFQAWVQSRSPLDTLQWSKDLLDTTQRSFEYLNEAAESSFVSTRPWLALAVGGILVAAFSYVWKQW